MPKGPQAPDKPGKEANKAKLPEAVLLAQDASGQIIGFAELNIRLYAEGCDSDRVAFLEGWYVERAFRGQGVGAMLVTAAEQWTVANGCTEFASDALYENAVGRAAHLAVGFEEVAAIRCFRKQVTRRD